MPSRPRGISCSELIIHDTAHALSQGSSRSARVRTPFLEVRGDRIVVLEEEMQHLSYSNLLRLDRQLHLAPDGEDPPFVTEILARTGTNGGRDDGLSRTALAERILDDLGPSIIEGFVVQGGAEGPNRELETFVIALRLAQAALWLCEREPGDPQAHELLPRAVEAAFLAAALPLRLLTPIGKPIDKCAAAIWQSNLQTPPDGDISVDRCRREARRARSRWLELLSSMERHPSLLAEDQAAMDRRLIRLVRLNPVPLVDQGYGRLARLVHICVADEPLLFARRPAPSSPDQELPGRPAPTGSERGFNSERQQLLDLTALHLLPRYLIDEAFGLLLGLRRAADEGAHQPSGSRLRALTWKLSSAGLHLLAALSAALLLALAVGFLIATTFDVRVGAWAVPAAWWSVGGLAVLWAGVLLLVIFTGGREGSYFAMLRMPATTAFGLAILLSFNSNWLAVPSGASVAALPLGFLLLAGLYLFIETVNQGAEGSQAVVRAVLLGTIGSGVALLMTFLALTFVAPAFFGATGGPGAAGSPTLAHLWALLLASTASFVLGTFLQAIWDEAPVTAPLSRLRLR